MTNTAKFVVPQAQEVLLTEEDFRHFSALIKRLAGIHMAPVKSSLVQGRLRNRVLQLGMKSCAEYRDYLGGLPEGHDEFQVFVNLLTTNKTEFFREADHFELLASWATEHWAKHPGKKLRIWCAASSTGEEPFTIAIVLAKLGGDFEVRASDIDTNVLAHAQRGVYSAHLLDQVPAEFQSFGFDRGRGEIKEWMRVKPAIHKRVSFFQHNLVSAELPAGESFDLVFCRNVLIYFQPDVCAQIVTKIHRVVPPGGLLFIGHSESLQNLKAPWKMVRASVYKKAQS